MNVHVSTESRPKTKRAKKNLCVECAGIGERDPENCGHLTPHDTGAKVVRAVYDNEGRWLIQWKELSGEEWVGAYRLLPV